MSPYDEGRTASAGGGSKGDNPYGDGTYHHAEWSRGFTATGESDQGGEAFDEGRAAAEAGKEGGSNPYNIDVEEDAIKAERWNAGYLSVEDGDSEEPEPKAEASTD